MTDPAFALEILKDLEEAAEMCERNEAKRNQEEDDK